MWKNASRDHVNEISTILKSLRLRATKSLEIELDANVDKEEMRAYLLGTLDVDRRTMFEERLRREPELHEELLAAEAELIDEYLAGDLSEVEQYQFETHFAPIDGREKKIRFGTLLNRYAGEVEPGPVLVDQAGQTAPAKKRFSFFLPFMSPRALAFGAVLVASVTVALLYWQATKRTAEQQALEQGESRTIVATLAPGLTRSAGTTNRVTVPPRGPFQVKLRLELTNASFDSYKSQLFRESKSLLTTGELKKEPSGAQQVVPVVIAGEYLSPGDYQLKLSGVLDSGADEFIDNYSFRITTD